MQHARIHPLALAISLVLATTGARAASIMVTDGGDIGTVTTCTLRQAIESANGDVQGASSCVAGSGADTIALANTLLNSTITLGGNELDVTAPLTIIGSSQIIDANHASRVMYVGDTTLAVSQLKFVNGANPGGGGAMALDGSTVTLTSVTISGSTAIDGAGIFTMANASLTLANSVVSGNTASADGGGIEIWGGGYATLIDTIVSGNSSTRAGGVFLYTFGNGTLASIRSSISGNTVSGSTQSGGGVYGSGCSSMTFTDSTISANTGNHQGGGILANTCPLTLVNTTVTGNASTVSGGGGVYVENGTATLSNSTISGNGAHQAGGVLVYKGNVTFGNTIVSANTAAAAYLGTADLAQYSTSTVIATYSLLGSALNVAAFNAAGNHNVFTDTPLLGSLQNNGGSTSTMALLAGSAAIDSGSNALAQIAGQPLQYDQRAPHFLRRFNGRVDIGAFEYQGDRIFAGIFEWPP